MRTDKNGSSQNQTRKNDQKNNRPNAGFTPPKWAQNQAGQVPAWQAAQYHNPTYGPPKPNHPGAPSNPASGGSWQNYHPNPQFTSPQVPAWQAAQYHSPVYGPPAPNQTGAPSNPASGGSWQNYHPNPQFSGPQVPAWTASQYHGPTYGPPAPNKPARNSHGGVGDTPYGPPAPTPTVPAVNPNTNPYGGVGNTPYGPPAPVAVVTAATPPKKASPFASKYKKRGYGGGGGDGGGGWSDNYTPNWIANLINWNVE